jgi:predicted DNA-binding protein
MADTLPPVVDKENLTVRVDKRMRERLDAAAEREDRSVAYVVRRLLEKGLDQEDEYERDRYGISRGDAK